MLEAVRRRAGQFGLDIIMINVWEHADARAEAGRFCQVHGIDGTVLFDETGAYANEVGVRGVPFNLVVDEHGIVRAGGVTTPQEIAEVLRRLLGNQQE